MNVTRREWMRELLTGSVRGLTTGMALFVSHATRDELAPPSGARAGLGILRPPGALAEDEFLAKCIRCTRCLDACEPRCIELFGASAGEHAGTPYIVARDRGCTMCLKCGPVCPVDALQSLPEKSKVRMGMAEIDTRLCVSHNGTGICGACFTACPLRGKAITQDWRGAPSVEEACTGCGLCEEACITGERRAIQVRTSRIWHDQAEEARA